MKTAVEILDEAFYNTEMTFEEILNKVKQIEKEQIIFSFIEGALISEKLESKPYTFINYAEQYYNETYGQHESMD